MADPVAHHDPNERDAFRYMDVFRFLAALVVVLEHVRDHVWVDAGQATDGPIWSLPVYFMAGLGHEAVMVFFVLSGFWITHSVERLAGSDRFWSCYLTDRLSRLLIVILPALAIGGVLDLIGTQVIGAPLYFGATGAHSIAPDVTARLGPAILLGNVVFLQTLVVPPFGSNGPLWSLTYEFWYYIAFAGLALAARRRLTLGLLALVVLIAWPTLLAGFLVWLLGSGLYYLDRRRLASQQPMARISAVALLLASSLFLLAAVVASRVQLVPEVISDLAIGLCFAALVWALLRGALAFPRRILSGAAEYGSGSSFSLYVLHYPLIACTLAVAGHRERLMPGVASAALIAALLIFAALVAWLFSRATEANTARVRNHVRKRLAT